MTTRIVSKNELSVQFHNYVRGNKTWNGKEIRRKAVEFSRSKKIPDL